MTYNLSSGRAAYRVAAGHRARRAQPISKTSKLQRRAPPSPDKGAGEAQADSLVDDIIDIATNDWMEQLDKDGESVGWWENGDAMKRSQMRIGSRKWLAGKLRPKKYGDKIEVDGKMTHAVDGSVVALVEAVNGKPRSI